MSKKLAKYIVLIIVGCVILLPEMLSAQKATVRATVQPSDIQIGEQAVINLEVIAPKGRNIIFPVYSDTIIKGIEVMKMLRPDTVMTEVMTINQKYLITSFDSTLYHVPYMEVIDGKDTLKSNDFGLKVTSPTLSDSTLAYLDQLKNNNTDSLDFDKLGIYDIKTIQNVPFVWTDYLLYILIPLGILLVLVIIGLIIYMVIKKKKKGYFFKPEVVLPAHVIALNDLDLLKSSKIWQKGQEKAFYIKLTAIIREYIDRQYNINAPEMTSDEIIDAVKKSTGATSAILNLQQILSLADLVKFAKYTPLPDENDLSLMNAYFFVNQTKVEELPKPAENMTDKSGEGHTENNIEKNKNEANS